MTNAATTTMRQPGNRCDSINEKNLERCVVAFLEKFDSMEQSNALRSTYVKTLPHARIKLKTLQLWRAVISECLAAFLYVFIVCGAASTQATAGNFAQTSNVTAIASGFTICVLTYCFQSISGAHINPAISVSMVVFRKITLLRGSLFVTAQCGGAIAGTALLYGVTVPTHYGNLNATVAQILPFMSPWERLGIEFVLAFFIVFAYCVTTANGSAAKLLANSAICVGFAYTATGLVSMPTQNPIRAFGPAFVMNRWEYHWVFWLGPCLGGLIAALVFEIVFVTQRKNRSDLRVDGDSVSIRSTADTYNDSNKARSTVMRTVNSSLRTKQKLPMNTGLDHSYCPNYYPTSANKTDPLYDGSRSLYTRSPPPTRVNLNRSQSVFNKSISNHVHQREQLHTYAQSGAAIPTYATQCRRYAMTQPPPPPPPPPPHSTVAFSNLVDENHQNRQRQGQGIDGTFAAKLPNGRDIYAKTPDRRDYGYDTAGTIKEGQYSIDNTVETMPATATFDSYEGCPTLPNSHQRAGLNHSARVDSHVSCNHNQSSPGSQF